MFYFGFSPDGRRTRTAKPAGTVIRFRTMRAPPYIERFHRSLKEEEVWTAEYRTLEEA